MMRKPTQIVVCKINETEYVHALCDDGTIWHEMWNGHQLMWVKKPDIPQDIAGDGHYESDH